MIDYRQLPSWFRASAMGELAGEKLLWAGMPRPVAAFRGAALLWLFAVPWMALTLFWEAAVVRLWYFQLPNGKGPPPGFGLVLWGLPFVLIGVVMMAVPYFAWRRAQRTVYVLTDKRLLFITHDRKRTVQSLNLRAITATARTEKSDGSGTLSISLAPYLDSEGDRTIHREFFHGIRDVRAVEALLRAAMERAQK